MLQFLMPTKAKLISVNPQSENHGGKLVPAIHLRFQLDVSNAVLEQLQPDLLDGLFLPGTQHQLPGVDRNSECTALRFAKLVQPLHWKDESIGNALTIDYGIGGESSIELSGGKVHKHVFTAKEGGTCTVLFTYSCAHDLTEHAVGRLGMRVQHDVYIVLHGGAPAEAEEGEPEEAAAVT